jgi:hypothetical protein
VGGERREPADGPAAAEHEALVEAGSGEGPQDVAGVLDELVTKVPGALEVAGVVGHAFETLVVQFGFEFGHGRVGPGHGIRRAILAAGCEVPAVHQHDVPIPRIAPEPVSVGAGKPSTAHRAVALMSSGSDAARSTEFSNRLRLAEALETSGALARSSDGRLGDLVEPPPTRSRGWRAQAISTFRLI